MTLQQQFELPASYAGEVIPHDTVYSKEQLSLQMMVDAIGTSAVSSTVEVKTDETPTVRPV
jgi:hypothetical protein